MSPSIKQKTAIPVFLFALVLACFAISRSAQAAEPSGIQDVNVFNKPFQREFGINLSDGDIAGSALVVATPVGKTLVVEFVSVFADFPAGEHPFRVSLSAHNVDATLLMNFQGSAKNDKDVFVASQQIRLYADATQTLQLTVRRDMGAGFVRGSVRISGSVIGYFVNTP